MNTGRGERWVTLQIVLLGAIAFVPIVLPGFLPDSLHTFTRIAGMILLISGLLLVGLSAYFLGSNLTAFPRPKDHGTLTQTGVYGIVRHPMYSGVLLSAFGWALIWANMPAILLSLVLGIFFDRKATQEEIWLSEKYLDYAQYKGRVRKLIPWIY